MASYPPPPPAYGAQPGYPPPQDQGPPGYAAFGNAVPGYAAPGYAAPGYAAPGYAAPHAPMYPAAQYPQQTGQQSVVVVGAPTTTVIRERPRVNHALHCIITFFFWPWVIVWIILCLAE